MNYVEKITKNKGIVSIMEHAGFKARLMVAPLLNGEKIHDLPPGTSLPTYPIQCLPGVPKSWINESGSYVCPVDTGYGLWFDCTLNDSQNTAVVPSVKGMNPITGQKIESLCLERFVNKCPIHKEPFTHGRNCLKCGYSWPPQNYISSPNKLWWDGFKQSDGTVRQFFFTDDDKRDIASIMIGKENVVPAFGFAFWRPKQPRHQLNFIQKQIANIYEDNNFIHYSKPIHITDNSSYDVCKDYHCITTSSNLHKYDSGHEIKAQNLNHTFLRCYEEDKQKTNSTKNVSIGAGAKICQNLEDDFYGIDSWQNKHSGLIRLYFCFEEQFYDIVKSGGIIDLKEVQSKEGYMKNMPVGN